jgi:hypothetical protein
VALRKGPDNGWYDSAGNWFPDYNSAEAAEDANQAAQQKKPPPKGPTGPSYQPSIAATHTNPAPSIFDAYSGPQIDAAKLLVKQEMTLLGFPQGVDTEQMALFLLQKGLETQPQSAFEALWQSSFLSKDMRQASPWARLARMPTPFIQI